VCCNWAYVPNRFLALPSNYRADKRVVLVAVTCNGNVLEHVAERYKKDLQVVYAAFKNNTGALQFAHSDVFAFAISSSAFVSSQQRQLKEFKENNLLSLLWRAALARCFWRD
jgi:hypothetical protein